MNTLVARGMTDDHVDGDEQVKRVTEICRNLPKTFRRLKFCNCTIDRVVDKVVEDLRRITMVALSGSGGEVRLVVCAFYTLSANPKITFSSWPRFPVSDRRDARNRTE